MPGWCRAWHLKKDIMCLNIFFPVPLIFSAIRNVIELFHILPAVFLFYRTSWLLQVCVHSESWAHRFKFQGHVLKNAALSYCQRVELHNCPSH